MTTIGNMPLHLGRWDLALLLVVSTQATAIAYLHRPRWKMLVFSLPVPFTLASLALGQPIDVTHAGGLMLLPGFMHAVRALHYKLRAPIVAAIAASAVAYCAAGAGLARVLPRTAGAFWTVAAATMALGLTLFLTGLHRDEPGHRSPLPLWIKWPAVAGVILALIALKQALAGFMAVFPFVGVVTAYEARHSLSAACRQVPAVMLGLVPMMATVRLLQSRLGLGPALLAGWAVFLAILLPLAWRMWFAAPAGRLDLEAAAR